MVEEAILGKVEECDFSPLLSASKQTSELAFWKYTKRVHVERRIVMRSHSVAKMMLAPLGWKHHAVTEGESD